MNFEHLQKEDPEILDAIKKEIDRQENKLEMIASENFTSYAVMEAVGSPLTNKYAEGYPAKRYYGGCEYVDVVEDLARDRMKKLFNAEHVNVQPHSGSSANIAVYFAMLKPGDTVMGMNLSNGGHLTHGSPVNISGNYYNFVEYGVDPVTEMIDYDAVRKIAHECKPKMIVAGASAYPRIIDCAKFKEIADEVDALLMIDMAHFAGLVVADLHPNPCDYADIVTTTTHKTLRGPRGGAILCKEKYAKQIDKAIFPGTQGGPLMHAIAAKAVSFKEALTDEFKTYQKQVVKNAQQLAETLKTKNFNLVSDGTDTHLILVNLINKNITGKDAEKLLDLAGITVNKNTVPSDPQSPFVTSGIRIGTPALTTRGMNEESMIEVAEIFSLIIDYRDDLAKLDEAKERIAKLCKSFPLYI